MELKDLLSKDVNELTIEELEARIHLLQRTRVVKSQQPSSGKSPKKSHKTNKDKQLEDFLGKMSKDELTELEDKLNKGEIK